MAINRRKAPPKATFKAERFNNHGKVVEKVSCTVAIIDGTAYLHIDGEKLMKSYVVPVAGLRRVAAIIPPVEGSSDN